MSVESRIKEYARAEGAHLIAIAPAKPYHEYLEKTKKRLQEKQLKIEDFMIDKKQTGFFEEMSDPYCTLKSARSVILLGVYSYDAASWYGNTERELRGMIARTYVYYPVARKIAERLASFLRDELGYDAVQGQNVPLKYAAVHAGLGSYGKNGLLLTKEYGSYVALRSVITSAPLTPDSLQSNEMCSGCTACLRACPTGALYAPYSVDPRFCINPITRSSSLVPLRLRTKMRNWIRGCDICQEICPCNQRLIPRDVDLRAGFDSAHHTSHRDLDGLEKTPELIPLLEESRPPIIRRNAAIALGNIGKGREDVLSSLEKHRESADRELKEYFHWSFDAARREV